MVSNVFDDPLGTSRSASGGSIRAVPREAPDREAVGVRESTDAWVGEPCAASARCAGARRRWNLPR
jgi:hypothetical protein